MDFCKPPNSLTFAALIIKRGYINVNHRLKRLRKYRQGAEEV
jgi:hypothetical protein